MQAPALPVIIPLLVAALLAGSGRLFPRRLIDSLAVLTTASVSAICLFLVHRSSNATIVYWFGGWHPTPNGHFPIGICFAVDPIGAGMAALVAILVLAAFCFSWFYFESVKSLYHALMLVFLAAMCGFCLTGDLFDLFVWFELMTASAVGLCGYKSEESWPLLGAFNFAVTNTVGAFLSLTGVGLLYALTGSLNMADIGRSLAAVHADAIFVSIAFLFVIAGFLVKAAAFPFHFWLADAHAVAPTPVCILFSGVMVELGIYAIARLYWVIFAPSLATNDHAVRAVFLTMGCFGAVFGGVYCFGQRHFKRLLAFSTISHVGLMMIGLALLTPAAIAGLAMYVLGHAMIKASLFVCAGILLHRLHSVDEFDLLGRGKNIKGVAILMLLGSWGLAGMPPFGTFYGEAFIDQVAQHQHVGWVCWAAMFGEAATAAAVLRVTARVFLGWGGQREATSRGAAHIRMGSETKGDAGGVPWCMWLPAALLMLLGMTVAALPQSRAAIQWQMDRFCRGVAYQSAVLDGNTSESISPSSVPAVALDWHQFVVGIAALCLAALSLFPQIWGKDNSRRIGHFIIHTMRPLRAAQSGRIGDYVAWLVLGIAVYGWMLLLLLQRR